MFVLIMPFVQFSMAKKPNDGKPYYPAHKDGDKANCSRTNLEWKRTPYVFNKNDSEVIERNGTKVTVYKDGRVKQNGKFLTMGDYIYDADTNLHVVIYYCPLNFRVQQKN